MSLPSHGGKTLGEHSLLYKGGRDPEATKFSCKVADSALCLPERGTEERLEANTGPNLKPKQD